MKLLLAILNINIFSGSLLAHADNTPNLCTAYIPYLTTIKPSDAASHPIPNSTVGGETYSGDEDHFVVRPPLGDMDTYKRVHVYIPGTTDRPELSSCLIKSAAETLDYPTLALSYQYLNSGDKFRNAKCESLAAVDPADQITCLEEQHKDAIDGGDYGATHFKADNSKFWDEVLPVNSLKQRLGQLLTYLHTQHPKEGWGAFLKDGMPKWDNIIVSGHSQGAGHAAYLAKTETLRGAVMISGPQDECTGCANGTKYWIDDGPYNSTWASYTALGHGNEPMYNITKDNWGRMLAAAGGRMNWKTAEPTDVGFALNTGVADALHSPLRTDVQYASSSTCGGKEHCSTAIDDSVPFTEKYTGEKQYLYEVSVWPALLKADNGGKKVGKAKGAKGGKRI